MTTNHGATASTDAAAGRIYRPPPQLHSAQAHVVRATFINRGPAPLAVRTDWNRMGCLGAALAAEPAELDRSALFRLAPGESRSFERLVPPPQPAGGYRPEIDDEVLVSVVTGCILLTPEAGIVSPRDPASACPPASG